MSVEVKYGGMIEKYNNATELKVKKCPWSHKDKGPMLKAILVEIVEAQWCNKPRDGTRNITKWKEGNAAIFTQKTGYMVSPDALWDRYKLIKHQDIRKKNKKRTHKEKKKIIKVESKITNKKKQKYCSLSDLRDQVSGLENKLSEITTKLNNQIDTTAELLAANSAMMYCIYNDLSPSNQMAESTKHFIENVANINK